MSHEVLVLNNDYEPLNVCNLRRAIVLVFLGKAEVLHTNDGVINMIDGAMDSPSVVKLRHHVKRPLPELRGSPDGAYSHATTIRVSTAANRLRELTIDHVTPKRTGREVHLGEPRLLLQEVQLEEGRQDARQGQHEPDETAAQAQVRAVHQPDEVPGRRAERDLADLPADLPGYPHRGLVRRRWSAECGTDSASTGSGSESSSA